MSLYTDLSYMLPPNGVKSGTIYALVPNDGTADMGFTRASTAYRYDSSGLLSSVATGVPRRDYTLGSCPSILFEPARTNLLLRSQEFDNASWMKSNVTINSNAAVAPDGTTTSDELVASNSGVIQHSTNQTVTTATSTTYRVSVFAKSGATNFLQIVLGGSSFTAGYYANFNLANGTVTASAGTNANPSITDYGNGYFRCEISGESVSTSGIVLLIPTFSGTATRLQTFEQAGESIYIWQAQMEVGSYATSIIPTTSATVTRAADAASLTGLKAKGLIGASAGSIGGEFYASSLLRENAGASLTIGTAGHRFYLIRNSTSSVRFSFIKEIPTGAAVYTTIQDMNKWLFAWDASGWFLSVNGSTVASGADVFTFPTDNITLTGAAGRWYNRLSIMETTKISQTTANAYTA